MYQYPVNKRAKCSFSLNNQINKLHSKNILKICQHCTLFNVTLNKNNILEKAYSYQQRQIYMCQNINFEQE